MTTVRRPERGSTHVRFSIRALLAVAGTVLAGLVLSAQQPPTPASPSAPQQQPPTFRSGTTVVEVDVMVRDGKGRFVEDLRPEDFEVTEDGVRQEISAIYRVVGPNEPATAPGAEPAALPALPAPSPQQVQRVIVFYFDHYHMAPGALERARKAALDFLGKDFRDGDVGGVLNGPLMVNNRLTSKREELEAAIRAVKPTGDPGQVTRELREWPRFVDIYEAYRVVRLERANEPGATTMLDVVTNRACRDQPDSCDRGGRVMVEANVQNKATQLVSFARNTGKQTLETITALSNGLARIPGRKTLIMLTEGFFVEGEWGDLRDVVARAARASVRIYALDTRGLNRGSASSDIFAAANPSQPELSAPSLGDTNADAPNSLAVDTGGFVIRNENDFGKAFTDIDRDTSSYYIVGFRTNKPQDGKYHPISVHVKRSGLNVRARKGYLAIGATAATTQPQTEASKAAAATDAGKAATPTTATPTSPTPPVPADAKPAAKPEPAKNTGGDAAFAVRARPPVAERVESLEAASGRGTTDKALADAARKGWDAYQRGDVAKAREALLPVANSPSAPLWARYVLGWSEYASNDYPAATAQWERVREAVPQFEPAYFDLADGYLQQREFGKAVSVLREAQKRWPKDVEVYNALGVVQMGRGAINDAVKTFEDGVAVAPSDATACYNLAKTLELRYVQAQRMRKLAAQDASGMLQDRDRALEYYRRVAELGGPNAEAAKEGIKRLGAQ